MTRSRRDPSALGVHLELRNEISEMTIMGALFAIKAKYMGVGGRLVSFPQEQLPEKVEYQDRTEGVKS